MHHSPVLRAFVISSLLLIPPAPKVQMKRKVQQFHKEEDTYGIPKRPIELHKKPQGIVKQIMCFCNFFPIQSLLG
jgi:hypothetical protein